MAQEERLLKAEREQALRSYSMGYVDGNTVRKPLPSPYEDPYEQEYPAREDKRQQQEEELRRKKARQQEIARKNQQKIAKIDLRYAVFLGAAVVVTLLSCLYYLSLQSQLITQSDTISSLESDLEELTDANTSTQERLNNSVNLKEVYEIAVQDLGMNYPTEDQIIYYYSTSGDYVKQYQEIPSSN